MPSSLATLRRPLVAVLALVLGLAAVAGPSSADELGDTRSEAEQVADRIEELQHSAEVLTEEYLDAQLAREQLDAQIADARRRAEQSTRDRDAVGSRLRDVAVEAYMSGGSAIDPGTDALLGASDANEATRRRGYAAALGEDTADLSDRYRGAASAAADDAEDLQALLERAEAVEADIAERRAATEERLTELRDLQDEIDGRLAQLVAAEQQRREEARRRAAEEAARRAPTPAPAPDPAPEDEGDDAPPTTAPPAPETPAPPAPEPPPPPGPSSGAEAAIAAARSVLGTPYKWAGASPEEGFDCSGLVLWAWAHGGKSLPHSSKALYAMSRKIPADQLQPGDLVFYNSPVSHVGLYIGGGEMIHAPHTGDVVKISSIYYWSALVGGGRV